MTVRASLRLTNPKLNPGRSQTEKFVVQPVLLVSHIFLPKPLPKRLYRLEISRALWLARFPG
jgi:hypothetical protein